MDGKLTAYPQTESGSYSGEDRGADGSSTSAELTVESLRAARDRLNANNDGGRPILVVSTPRGTDTMNISDVYRYLINIGDNDEY